MDTFIEIQNLKKTYHVGYQTVEALRGVDLEIKRSDFIVLLGHSGSGKTTLVSIIGGLTKPSEGRVVKDGMDLWSLNDLELSMFRNQNIGFMFQAFSLLPNLSTLNNVVLPAIFNKNGSRADIEVLRDKAIAALKDLEIGSKVNSFPSELSGGEQRRVAIARALINDPEIILADEPTGELDIRTEQEVIDIFRQVNEQYKKTVIVVSHSLTWAERAKTVILMKDGRVRSDVNDPVKALMGEGHDL
ncbi:MAG: ABC transporter ATP-binding protein [Deltaproteobacteria bacterium]